MEAFHWLQKRIPVMWLEDYQSHIADFKSWHARSVYFLDPAGNIGELISRFDLDDIQESPFSLEQIRNISEIGLVFPDQSYETQVNKLLHDYPLQYFAKQPPLEHFRAIGDDRGLFIVVPKQRNWFSTQLPCGIFPISLRFIQNGSAYEMNL